MKKEERQLLLNLSKNTIAKNLGLHYEEIDGSKFSEKKGAFVTLKKDGKLRGCIGYLFSNKPLYQTIIEASLKASFKDYRFKQLSKEEYNSIEIEISVLTKPKIIKNLSEFEIRRDGIIMTIAYNRSVFLPQVAKETGWNKRELLEALSKKAGLPFNAYKRSDAEFMTFQAEVFS